MSWLFKAVCCMYNITLISTGVFKMVPVENSSGDTESAPNKTQPKVRNIQKYERDNSEELQKNQFLVVFSQFLNIRFLVLHGFPVICYCLTLFASPLWHRFIFWIFQVTQASAVVQSQSQDLSSEATISDYNSETDQEPRYWYIMDNLYLHWYSMNVINDFA